MDAPKNRCMPPVISSRISRHRQLGTRFLPLPSRTHYENHRREWGIIVGFALTLAGLILRLANLVQLSRSIRWIAIAYNFAIPFVTLGVLIGTFQMNAMPSFGAFLNEYADVITAPALLPWLFTGTLLSDLFLPYRMGELKSHTPTFGSESEKKA